MSKVIYWFSGSGNSLHVAKVLKERLDDVELIPVAQAVKSEIRMGCMTGLVFPVYAWGPPVIVAEFISMLPEKQPGYLFAVATCGGAAGSTMSITRKMLARRALNLDASFTLKMVENYPAMGGAPEKEEQKILIEAAEGVIDGIAEGIARQDKGDFGKKSLFFSLIGRMVYGFFSRSLEKQKSTKFFPDDKCTSCGICAKICPVGNIEMVEGRPEWGLKCEQCYACFHWCPEEAVQYGKKTLQQVRYHHPGADLKDMLFHGEGE